MRSFHAVLAFVATIAPALAQPVDQTSRVPTVTRLVKIFTDLEARLDAQAHSSDGAALAQMVDPAFEMRVGSSPGVPVPRDDWLRQARTASAAPIEQMAVHDFGAVAVVSFRRGPPAGGSGGAAFIVDVWNRVGDGWRLATRYASDAASDSIPAIASPPTIDKRY